MVLACRNWDRGLKLKMAFEREAVRLGLKAPSLEVMLLDVADLKSVRRVVEEWREQRRMLHVLINNAGIFDMGGKPNS